MGFFHQSNCRAAVACDHVHVHTMSVQYICVRAEVSRSVKPVAQHTRQVARLDVSVEDVYCELLLGKV